MPIPRVSSQLALLAALLVMVSLTGCVPWARGIRSIDDTITDWRDYVWGKRAYYQRYGNDQSSPFQDGFLEGYHDILDGGDGCLPVVPPKRYWGWRYQSAGGQSAVNDWFSGYQAGVEAAKEDGLAKLSCIPTAADYTKSTKDPMEVDPMEVMPMEEPQEMGPLKDLNPDITPPTIEPPRTTDAGWPGKSRGNNPLSTRSAVRPASGSEPIGLSPVGGDMPLPLGTGVIPVTPLMPSDNSRPLADPNSTSRRNRNTPLSSNRIPVIRQPMGPAVSSPGHDYPLPVYR